MKSRKSFVVSITVLCLFLAIVVSLVACSTVVDFKVNFIVDGEVYRTIKTSGNERITLPPNPTKDGYVFDGWYRDKDVWSKPFTAESLLNEKLTSDISVYAKWADATKTYYTVSFDLNGGDGEIADQSYAVGEIMKNLPVPNRDGYRFVCWETVFDEEYNVTSIMPNENITLIAKWEKIVTKYEDEYVTFKPATEGKKQESSYYDRYTGVQQYLYIELTSDDLGGINKVGKTNNFDLTMQDEMEFSVEKGYTLLWYEGSWNNPNGAQMFTLNYGSNIQLLTVSEGQRVVKRYLVDIYVRHDYYVYLYKNIFEQSPYEKVRVIENNCFEESTEIYESPKFEFDSRVYYNNTTKTYEKFVYSTVITRDWHLYQTYKPVSFEAELNGGSIDNDLVITPYTQYFTLPSAEKSGFDFMGWKLANDEFITNIQGYSGINYLSEENCPDKLIASFAERKNYYTFDGTELKTVKTIPTVIYTDNTMSKIFDIVYTPYNTDCVLPTKVPSDNNKIFKDWSWYYKNSNGEFSKNFSNFNFNTKITEPLALVPTMESCNDYVIPLNKTITSSGYKTYKMYLPVAQIYTLKVTTTGNVKFTTTLQEGSMQGQHTYTVTSSSPSNISLRCYVYNYGAQVTTFGYVTLTVDSYSGYYSFTLIGDAAQSEGNPVVTTDENTANVGDEYTVQLSKPGYSFAGWYKDGIKISSTEFLSMEEEDSIYTAKWIECPVTIEKSISEAGTVSGIPETTAIGQEITVMATSKSGYTWVGWYNGDTLLTSDMSYTFNMPEQNITYTAKWIKVTINKSISNAGIVSALDSTYKVGDSITITATTNNSYTWVGWYNGNIELTKEQSYTFNMPTEDITYTAKWIKVTLLRNDTYAGNITLLNGKYKVGDEVTVTASTNSGYTWLGWYNGEEELSKDPNYTFSMPFENVQYTAKWVAYTVTTRTEDSSAGSVTYMNAVKTRFGDEVAIIATPRAGYTFAGWYEDDTLISTDQVYTFSMPAKSIVYTAKWTYYTLTTDLNDVEAGSVLVYDAQKISVGQSVTIKAETNNGYTFQGWYNGETLLSTEEIYTFNMPAENIVYTARWTSYTLTIETTEGGYLNANNAIISFNLNDGTDSVLLEQQITDSVGLVYPDVPTRSGYVFAGWYSNADCTGLPFDFSATVYSDTMLYARWIPYTGTGFIPINSQMSVSVTSKNSSSKAYYAFVPLCDGTITIYTTGNMDTYGYLYDSEKTQLTVNDDDGDGNNFKITYNVTAGVLYYVSPCGYSSSGTTTLYVTGAMPKAGGKFYQSNVDWQVGHIATVGTLINLKVVTNVGYTFEGWFKDGELISKNLNYKFTMLSENVVLVAKWIECPVTLEKNMDEAGSVSGLESPVVVGEDITITASTNNGYTWLGWYAGDSLLTTELSYTFAMPSDNIVYTAKWAEYTLTIQTEGGSVTGLTDVIVSFDLNGGEGEIISQSVNEGNPLIYPEIPSREGYVFKGWYIDKECTSLYDFTQSLSYNITLYAGWHAMVDGLYYIRQEINIVEDNNSISNYMYFSTEGSSENKKAYTYFTALTAGEYTIYVKNSTTENHRGVTLEVINLTKNMIIQEEIDIKSTSYSSIDFTADGGDVICVLAYRYNTGYSSTFYIYVEGGAYPEDGGLPLNTSSLKIEAGREITLKAINDSGYTWLGWYNGSEKLSNDQVYTFIMPYQSITLTPKWAKYTLSIQAAEGGSVSYDGFVPNMYPITAGESVTIIAETYSGYIWLGWFNGEVKVSNDIEFTFTMPNHSVYYTAKWVYYTVTTNSNYDNAGMYTIKDNEKVVPGEEVSLSASTNSGYTWIGWFDGDIQLTDELIYTFIMPETSVVYTAKWSKVSLEKNMVDAGTITGLDGKYVVGDSVTIAVETNDGYAWLGWYNGETELSKDLSYTMTMSDNDLTITAKWIRITLKSDDLNAGSVNTITGNNKVGDEYTAVAITKPGYTFVGWYENDSLLSVGTQYTFNIPSNNVTYVAKWIKVNIEKNIENAGTVTSLIGTYLVGDEATVVANSKSGYTWLGWYKEDELITTNFELKFEMPNSAVTYTAKWITCPVIVTLNDEDAGTYSGLDGNVINSEVELTAQTNSGYTWVGWYKGEELLTDSLTYTFNLTTEETVLTAKWAKITLNKNMSEAGEVTQLNSTYKVGDYITITAQTNAGYTWVGWYDEDMLLTNDTEYSFEMTGNNATYTAKWIKIDLTVNNSLAGTVTGLSDAYKIGDNVTVTATSKSGYIWVGWYNGEELLTRAKEYTFSMPSESATYTANWIKITLNTNIKDGGKVSGLEGENLSYGDNAVVTATPYLGYNLLGWYNGDDRVSLSKDYSFIIGDKEMTLTAKWEVKPEMEMFVFSSTETSCSITGVKDASSVTVVHIPSYVTSVSSSGFKNCHDIATITVETGNVNYRSENNCLININTQTVVLGCKNSVIPTDTDVTTLGEAAFYGRYGLTSIVIPRNIIMIPAYSSDAGQFAYCKDLTSVEWEVDLKLSPGLDRCIANTFLGCTKLSEFTMTGSNSYYYTVDNCLICRPTAWAENDHRLILACNPVSIPAEASIIASNAFVLCADRTSLVVPDTIKEIEQGAFNGMSSLEELTLPFVGRDAEFNTSDLYSGPYLFGYVFGSKSYENSIAIEQYGVNQDPAYKYTYYVPKGLVKVTLTNGVVGTNGFMNWKNLKELVGVVSLGHSALLNCTGITSIDLSKCQSINTLALSGTSITSVTIPDGCNVRSSAFKNCKQLNTVVWNYNYIEDTMFEGCSSLQSIILTSKLTIIGDSAFKDCISLQSITLPNALTKIGDSAFYGCTSLTSMVIPANVTYVGALAFGECSKLNSVTFKDTNNWVRSRYNTISSSGNEYFAITVSDPTQNAENLKDISRNTTSYWYSSGWGRNFWIKKQD